MVCPVIFHGNNRFSRKPDWICNEIGNWAWVSVLDWTGGKEFNQAETRDWEVDGKVAGETRSSGLLTWVTIDGAGHLVSLHPVLRFCV